MAVSPLPVLNVPLLSTITVPLLVPVPPTVSVEVPCWVNVEPVPVIESLPAVPLAIFSELTKTFASLSTRTTAEEPAVALPANWMLLASIVALAWSRNVTVAVPPLCNGDLLKQKSGQSLDRVQGFARRTVSYNHPMGKARYGASVARVLRL